MVKFNSDGYLEPGLHDLTVDSLEEHFVTGFPTSTTRPNIIEGYKRHNFAVNALGISGEQFLDGSFVSTKNDPGDIDLVQFSDSDSVDELSALDKIIFGSLFAGQATKATHLCDAYFCPTVPETDPRYPKLRSARKYWLGEFGYDRQDKPKGIIRAQLASMPGTP